MIPVPAKSWPAICFGLAEEPVARPVSFMFWVPIQ
jgi:hypothetical protein